MKRSFGTDTAGFTSSCFAIRSSCLKSNESRQCRSDFLIGALAAILDFCLLFASHMVRRGSVEKLNPKSVV